MKHIQKNNQEMFKWVQINQKQLFQMNQRWVTGSFKYLGEVDFIFKTSLGFDQGDQVGYFWWKDQQQ